MSVYMTRRYGEIEGRRAKNPGRKYRVDWYIQEVAWGDDYDVEIIMVDEYGSVADNGKLVLSLDSFLDVVCKVLDFLGSEVKKDNSRKR